MPGRDSSYGDDDGRRGVRSLGRSVGHSVGRSVGHSLGRSVGHSLDRSVGHSVGRPRVDDDEGFRSNARASRVRSSPVRDAR